MNAPSLDMTKLQLSMTKIEVESMFSALREDFKKMSVAFNELKNNNIELSERVAELEKKAKKEEVVKKESVADEKAKEVIKK